MPPTKDFSDNVKSKKWWSEETAYSRLGSIILFIGFIPVLSFYTGQQYQLLQQEIAVPVITPHESLQPKRAAGYGPTEAIDNVFWKDNTYVFYVEMYGDQPHNGVFFATTTVPNADPITFERIGSFIQRPPTPHGGATAGYYRDKNTVYYYSSRLSLGGEYTELFEINEADPESFELFPATGPDEHGLSDAKDKNHIYFNGKVSDY